MPILKFGTGILVATISFEWVEDYDIREVGLAYKELMSFRELTVEAARSAVMQACEDQRSLRDAVVKLLDTDASKESVFRLLPFAIFGAICGSPTSALPVCVLSRLWWAGAEALDDLNDGGFDHRETGLSVAAATVASAACITVLPQVVLAQHDFPPGLELDLTRELVDASVRSASGQIDDTSAQPGSCSSWAGVMRTYAGNRVHPTPEIPR